MSDKVSVIISVYNAPEYIEECLDSVNNQTHFKDNDYEILLGIDNCQDTLNKVLEIKHKYKNLNIWWFEENLGPYIVFNTLIKLATGDVISIFGADDVMKNDFISYNLSLLEKNTFVVSKGISFNNKIPIKEGGGNNPDGVVLFYKDDFMKLKGFTDWRCGADTDLIRRFLLIKHKRISAKNVTYYRRIHKKQLTRDLTYGYSKPYRIKIRDLLDRRKRYLIIYNEEYKTYENIKKID